MAASVSDVGQAPGLRRLLRPPLRALAIAALIVTAPLAAQTVTIHDQEVPYTTQGGLHIVQGDIVVGSDALSNQVAPISPSTRLWPGGLIPYTVDRDVEQQQDIEDAIRHWEERTPIRFAPYTDQSNYVRFRVGDSGCFSAIGMTGGEQSVQLSPGCTTATIIHEIGHTAGLWHEQSREDRDRYLTLNLDALDPVSRIQWEAHITDGDDQGPYDFASIMHYGTGLYDAGNVPVAETKPSGIPTGQGDGLSAADIDGVLRLYGVEPAATTIATHPAGLPVTVDGATYTAPHAFDWAPGTVHTIEVVETYADGDTRQLFARWSDEGPRAHQIEASADVTAYTAYFRAQYRMTGWSEDETHGTVTVETDSEDRWSTDGSLTRFHAMPNPGFYFLRWVTADSPRPVSSQNPLELRPRGPQVIYVAQFTAQPPTTITTDPPQLPVAIDGNTYRAPGNFDWQPGSEHTLAIPDLDAGRDPADTRDRFLNWSDGGTATHTIQATAEGGTIIARYERSFHVDLLQGRVADVFVPEVPGTTRIEPPSEDGFYPAGTEITVIAQANPGFRFVSWTGDLDNVGFPAVHVRLEGPLRAGAWFAKPGAVYTGDVVNAAHYLTGPVAPGEIVTLFGIGLGPLEGRTLELDAEGKVATSLAGTEVRFSGIPAPILYTSDRQVSTVVPYGVAGQRDATLQLSYLGGSDPQPTFVTIESVAPGFFTADGSGRGQIAALNQDTTPNGAANPAEAGSVIVLYATGTGTTDPPSEDGAVTAPPLPHPTADIRVWIGWRRAEILYAGPAPGLVAGATQINVRIPNYLDGAEIPVVLQVGGDAGGVRAPNFFTIAVAHD